MTCAACAMVQCRGLTVCPCDCHTSGVVPSGKWAVDAAVVIRQPYTVDPTYAQEVVERARQLLARPPLAMIDESELATLRAKAAKWDAIEPYALKYEQAHEAAEGRPRDSVRGGARETARCDLLIATIRALRGERAGGSNAT